MLCDGLLVTRTAAVVTSDCWLIEVGVKLE